MKKISNWSNSTEKVGNELFYLDTSFGNKKQKKNFNIYLFNLICYTEMLIQRKKKIYEETAPHTAMKFCMELEEICTNHITDLSR